MVVADQTDSMYQGNRRKLVFTIVDEDSPLTVKPPKDLTGFVVKFALARFDQNGLPVKKNPLVDLSSTGSQITVTGADNNVIEVTLEFADTATVSPNDYYFEVEVFDVMANSEVVATGTLTIMVNVNNA